jgi:pyruvate formate lyase activating enzyme
MKIGGFIKQSLIDFPGKIAAVIFTQGCNFCCGYCHNPQLVLPELYNSLAIISNEYILQYLQERTNWLEGVVITGGEPTIQKGLYNFMRSIKKMGYIIKLDTNGSNPTVIKNIIDKKLVDYVAIDIKVPLESKLYSSVIGITNADIITKNIAKSIKILKRSNINVEYRITTIPGIHDEKMIKSIENYIGNENHLERNEFRDGNTINSFNN